MRDIDLRVLMDSLYDTLDYYATVEPDGTIEYEEEYHKVLNSSDKCITQ